MQDALADITLHPENSPPMEAAGIEPDQPRLGILPGGRISNADIVITAVRTLAEANTRISLDPKRSHREQQLAQEAIGAIVVADGRCCVSCLPHGRSTRTGSEGDQSGADQAGRSCRGSETYRRIEVAEGLRMLHVGSVPAFG